jgi:hypothetical protein
MVAGKPWRGRRNMCPGRKPARSAIQAASRRIERGGADHQVEGSCGPGQLLGGADHKTQPVVGGRVPGGLDHCGRGVDSGQGGGLRGAGGKPAKQVAGPAPDVEDVRRGWHAGKGQVRRAVGDLVMQPAAPALVISLRTLAERHDITMTGHT